MQHKIGDTFFYLVTLDGVEPGELAGYTPSSQVRSSFGTLYGQAICQWADAGDATQVQLLISDTRRWRPGPAVVDIQFTRDTDGFDRSTDTLSFTIVQDVTRP
jgi:hypothetical protein